MATYPADFETSDGTVVLGGQIDFTDAGDQPGGGFTAVSITSADSVYQSSPGELVVADDDSGGIDILLPVSPPLGSEVAVWVATDPDTGVAIGALDVPINGSTDPVTVGGPGGQYSQIVVAYTGADGWAILSDGVPGGGGGLPTGWTADNPDPGDLDMADGKLATAFPIDFSVTTAAFGTDVTGMGVGPGLVLFDEAGANVVADTDGGVSSAPSGGVAYAADGSNGATIALDAGGLDIANAGDVTSPSGIVTASQCIGGAVDGASGQIGDGGVFSQNTDESLVFAAATGPTAADGTIGFFNAGPVAQPVVPATPLPQDIVDALVALGLVSQSA